MVEVVGVVGVVTSCLPCARVRGRVSRSCATENTYTPARLVTLFKLSVVTILSHSYHSLPNFCGLRVFSPTRHLVRDLIASFLLAVCSVAIHLVHSNTNLFLSRWSDHCPWISLQSSRQKTRWHFTWDTSLVELEMRIRLLFSLKSHAQLSVSIGIQRPKHNLAGETRIDRPNSLFHDLAVRFDRIAAKPISIFVRDLDIAYVHDLLRVNELSFVVVDWWLLMVDD